MVDADTCTKPTGPMLVGPVDKGASLVLLSAALQGLFGYPSFRCGSTSLRFLLNITFSTILKRSPEHEARNNSLPLLSQFAKLLACGAASCPSMAHSVTRVTLPLIPATMYGTTLRQAGRISSRLLRCGSYARTHHG